jgi:hypothetical protein
MKNKNYHTVGTFQKSNRKIVERGKIDAPNTQMHGCSLFWRDTDTSVKSGGVKLVVWPKLPIQALSTFV